jgi:hypothetical protein
MPGTTRLEREWHTSLADAHEALHAAALLHGEPVIWPDPARSPIGRSLRAAATFIRQIQAEGIECDL